MDKQLEAVSDSISWKGILEEVVEEWGGGLSRETAFGLQIDQKDHSRKGLLWEKDSLGRMFCRRFLFWRF